MNPVVMHEAGDRKDGRKLPILIVDDHALVRQGIRAMLEAYADLQIVGEASDGFEAVTFAKQLRPRIVLMDINMPRMNGIEATAQIMRDCPDMLIIGLSVNATSQDEEVMKRAGAVRLILKDESPDVFYHAIHTAVKSREISEQT